MERSNIRVTNHNRSRSINERFIRSIASEILRAVKKPATTELEIVFLSDERMRALNKKYADSDRPTDVLSFKLGEKEFGRPDSFIGEILISSDTAARNSKVFGSTFGEEIILYVIHGILHLFGYDDADAGSRARMSEKENVILRELCRKEDLSKVSTPR
jgi:probable rRNA maturation factor